MKESKKLYRIGHVAQQVGVEKFVIRFWEKEFNLPCQRTDGRQRSYRLKDIDNFKRIKSLLYDQGLTIAGARKLLENNGSDFLVTASAKTTMHQDSQLTTNIESSKIIEQILALRQQLIKLKEIL